MLLFRRKTGSLLAALGGNVDRLTLIVFTKQQVGSHVSGERLSRYVAGLF